MTTGHCSVWSSNNTGCPIEVCQQEQLETVWNQQEVSQGESLNVHCLTSTNTFGMMFSTTWVKFKDMAQNPLVRREPVSASCNRRPDEGLETQKYSLYPNEHPANCPLRWRLSNGLRVYLSWVQAGFSHHTRQHNWWSVHQRRLAISCWPHFDNHHIATRPVYMDNNARPHRSRAVTVY
jgi:hypothetical protein